MDRGFRSGRLGNIKWPASRMVFSFFKCYDVLHAPAHGPPA